MFSFLTGQVSLPCNILLRTQLLYNLPLTVNDISLLVSNGTNCLNLFIQFEFWSPQLHQYLRLHSISIKEIAFHFNGNTNKVNNTNYDVISRTNNKLLKFYRTHSVSNTYQQCFTTKIRSRSRINLYSNSINTYIITGKTCLLLKLPTIILQPFYGSLDFVRDYLGKPGPKETFINSHLSHTHYRFTALLEYVRDHPGEQVPKR